MFDFLLLALLGFLLFCFSVILAGVIRCEKHLKLLQEDFRIFLNNYFNVNK